MVQAAEPGEGRPTGRGRRLGAVGALVALFLGLTVVYPAWTGHRADQGQSAIYDGLDATYGGTTSADIDGLFVESFSPGDGGRFEDFFNRAEGLRPYRITAVDEGRGYQARYGLTYSGQRRCVLATWRIDGFTLERRAGETCEAPTAATGAD